MIGLLQQAQETAPAIEPSAAAAIALGLPETILILALVGFFLI